MPSRHDQLKIFGSISNLRKRIQKVNNQSNDKNETRHAKKILDAVNGLIAILDTANVDVFDEKLKELKSV